MLGRTVGALVGALLLVGSAGIAHADPIPRPLTQAALAGLYSTTSMELVLLERKEGAVAALAELNRRVAANPQLGGVCHMVAHDLGHEALRLAGGDAATALTVRDDVCGGGFTHGIVEMALGASKDPERDLLRICAPRQDGSCFHGVGHGLMFATRMSVKKSLALCDKAPSRTLSLRCGEGVFMQFFSADDAASPVQTSMGVDAAGHTCEHTRMRYRANCWFYAPTVWLGMHPDDFSGAMAWCAQSGSGRDMCARGVGSRTIKYHPDNPRIGARVCAGSGSLLDPCLAGMGSYWSVHHKGQVPASDVCSHLGSSDLAARCRVVTAQ